MEDQDIVAYKSSFLPSMNINIVFKENPNYDLMKNIFDQYGYGFLAPEFKTIFLDGEIFLGEDGLTMDDLKFIEAHEVAHLLLNHNGPRSENDELEADLGAYILLKKFDMSTDKLIDEFEYRHGIRFDTDLLKKVQDRL